MMVKKKKSPPATMIRWTEQDYEMVATLRDLKRIAVPALIRLSLKEMLDRELPQDQKFIADLEKRSMSSWTDAEMARYNRLTGQSQ